MKEYRLCYIDHESHMMYFTDDMEHVWGDDWDDAPYEDNAGEPYRRTAKSPEHGTGLIRAVRYEDWGEGASVHWLSEPHETYGRCLSVEEINKKRQIPWLSGVGSALYAGATIEEAREFFKKNGWKLAVLDEVEG